MGAYYEETSDAARDVGSQTKYHPMGAGVLGIMAGENSAAQPAELRNAIERAQKTCENLSGIHQNLTMHLDRILGTRPEPASSRGEEIVGLGPDCEISALRNALSDIESVARRIRSQVERLESL